MKNKYFKITYYLLLITFPLIISAYTLLQPLPGNVTEVSKLSDYLSWLFKFALAAAAFLAVLQIVIGGLQIISGGASETARSNAKKRIQDALWGLLLAFGAVLILETISPGQFTNLSLSITPVTIKAPTPAPPPVSADWNIMKAKSNETRDYLKSGCNTPTKDDICVLVNKGPCPNSYADTNCTMVSEMPDKVITGLLKIQKESNAYMEITGGTEKGIHAEHGPNKPVVDLAYNQKLLNYFHDQVGLGSGEKMITNKKYSAKDGSFTVMNESTHFHVVFK